ncbi:glycosyltransferase family 39 protein [Actinoplanes sp. Pm04-4]|uniref:Glycosyltransferase family 39 protein n=1 Tax=Paractinoplanes pyxinae TaxID=2997416 RepID=A0ABT4BDG8_9ACTN|nr:glycosyltransferase family 39 protein [Actinoplanes pyxinae]MCY1144559.1 glycosyltransferase family 39 protein [Actinoplanes pyxinae]
MALLVGAAVLYLWDLSASGWGNNFYAAAAQAGAQSWKAWLFGSLDAGNAITVDKPPAALWVMGLSARIFGVNSWAILAPQALMGVASVWFLYAAVKRWFGTTAGLVAGAALALTPVAVLMFRYDNPDALLVLLMTAGAYTTVRAVEKASWKWLALTGVLLGFGFLAKMMQAFLVLPGFALVYLVAAPTGLGKRIRDLLVAGLALVVSAGWYVALVSLWPASSRPYIAGSTNNTLWELALGYNGLGRILGGSGNGGGGGGGGGGGNTGFGGATGIGRLFGSSMGLEISWLLPAALIALVAVLAATWRTPRTDRTRAAMVMWGGWVLVTGLTFSFMSGTIHPYYTVALAPGIAALVGICGRVLWQRRDQFWGRALLAAMIAATAVWGWVLLGRTDWLPALRWVSLALGVTLALFLLVLALRWRRLAVVALAAAILSAGAGSAAYAAATVTVPHTGSIPSSGPSGVSTGGMGGGMGGRGFNRDGGQGGPPSLDNENQAASGTGSSSSTGSGTGATGSDSVTSDSDSTDSTSGAAGAGSGAAGSGSVGSGSVGSGSAASDSGSGGATNIGSGGTAGAADTGSGSAGSGSSAGTDATTGSGEAGSPAGDGASAGEPPSGGGGMGGGTSANSELTALLKASTTKWSAAISGATSAADLELASGTSVIALGGWNGSDPSPTLAQFQAYVAAGQVHYYISGGGMGGGGGAGGESTQASQIASWVADHYTATTVGSTTVYDLTQTAG